MFYGVIEKAFGLLKKQWLFYKLLLYVQIKTNRNYEKLLEGLLLPVFCTTFAWLTRMEERTLWNKDMSLTSEVVLK